MVRMCSGNRGARRRPARRSPSIFLAGLLLIPCAVGVRAGPGPAADPPTPPAAPAHVQADSGSAATHLPPSLSAPRDDRARAHHRFEDPARWERVWDDPERQGWQEPQRVVDLLRTRPGMTVADIGAGTGYFEPYLSRAVGSEGRVYAIDVEPAMVDHLRERAKSSSLGNIEAVLATAEDPRIPVRPVDRVLCVDTYHHIDGRVAYFGKLLGSLGPESIVAIVDWLPGTLARGPRPDHKVDPEQVLAEMRAAGYMAVERVDLRYQFVLLFRPAPSAAGSPAAPPPDAGSGR